MNEQVFRFWWFSRSVRRTGLAPRMEWSQRRVWLAPAWESWMATEDLPWWLWLTFGLSCIAVGAALAVWPALLSIVVAALFVAGGVAIVAGAVSSGLDSWQRRPRHIHVKRSA